MNRRTRRGAPDMPGLRSWGQVLNYQFLGCARPLLPVVRVPAEDALGAVELLGQERAGQQVRPGRAAEGKRQPYFGTAVLRDIDTRYVTGYN